MLAPDLEPSTNLIPTSSLFPVRSHSDPARLRCAGRVGYLLVGQWPQSDLWSLLPDPRPHLAGLILFDLSPPRHSSFIQQTVSVSLSNQICSNQLFSSTKHHSQSADLQLSKIVNNFEAHRIGGSLHTVQWLPARSVLTFSSSNNILSLSCDGRHYF